MSPKAPLLIALPLVGREYNAACKQAKLFITDNPKKGLLPDSHHMSGFFREKEGCYLMDTIVTIFYVLIFNHTHHAW
jgi:hypothetical protein